VVGPMMVWSAMVRGPQHSSSSYLARASRVLLCMCPRTTADRRHGMPPSTSFFGGARLAQHSHSPADLILPPPTTVSRYRHLCVHSLIGWRHEATNPLRCNALRAYEAIHVRTVSATE